VLICSRKAGKQRCEGLEASSAPAPLSQEVPWVVGLALELAAANVSQNAQHTSESAISNLDRDFAGSVRMGPLSLGLARLGGSGRSAAAASTASRSRCDR